MKYLKVELLNTDKIWYYGHPEIRNYGSPSISLDDNKGKLKLKKGLYSIDGFASIEDKNDIVLETGHIEKKKNNNIDINNIIVHAPYIINLANDKENDKYDFSINFLKQEIERCEELKMSYLVLHPGSHVGLGIEKGINNIIYALNEVLKDDKNVTILLETMAGKGTEVGSNFQELKEIIDGINKKELIGVCMDTCHLNDSGYDITDFDSILDEFDRIVGLSYLKCIHINDSKNIKGAKKDRHENIGYGTIGFDTLIKIIYNPKLDNIPKILETPYINDKPPYKEEIAMIREKKFNDNLKNLFEK